MYKRQVGIVPMVYFNYARVLDLCGRYEDSAECAEEGRKACLKYGHYQYLPPVSYTHPDVYKRQVLSYRQKENI